MGINREEGGASRYTSEKYNRKGSRYDSEEYNRKGSRYSDTGTASGSSGSTNRDSEKPSAVRMKTGTAALAAAGVLILFYAAGAVHYSRHFYAGTEVLGMDCSGMTAEEVRELIEGSVSNYRLTVEERNGDQSLIYASQIDLAYVENDTLEQALDSQKSALWPLRMGTGAETVIPVQTVYEEDKLQSVLGKLPFLDEDQMISPVDAHLIYSDNVLAVEPEVMGTTLKAEKTETVIAQALASGLSLVSLEEEDCYVDPDIYSDDEQLNREMEAKNEILGACVTLNFTDRTETVDAGVIDGWLTEQADGSYTLSDEPVWNYIAGLAEKYDTYGGDRIFESSIGTTEYLSGGDYGWQLDQDETAQTLLNAIRDKKVGMLDPIYTHTARDRSEDDIGDTYVEICIARQQMWFYKNGELLVDTPVVTGNPSKQNDTPAGGVWALDGKYLNFTLVGEDYRTPVSYWMPFNGGVGIHDLQSRAYFGGTIYLTNGSHGCVNTPLTAVATIYDNIEVGTPVIVYTGEV